MSQLKVNSISDSAGANGNAITLASDGTCTVKATNNLSNRRININGAMTVAQRGSAAVTAYSYQTVDRYGWDGNNVSSSASTQQQGTNAPDGFKKCYRIDITTAKTSLAASDYSPIFHFIEAQDCTQLAWGTSAAKSITISFWVRTNKTGTYCLNIRNHDSNRARTSTYSVSSADTWEKKTITFSGDTSGNEFNADNGHGILIYWHLSSGSDFTSSDSTSWGTNTNSGFCYGQQVNIFDSTSNYFELTGVQLEEGDVATDFEYRSYGDELARCERYYQVLGSGAGYYIGGCSFYQASQVVSSLQLRVTMRDTPSIDQTTGTNYYRVYANNTYDAFDGWTGTTAASKWAAGFWTNGTATGTIGHAGIFYISNAAGHLAMESEL